MTLRLFGSHDCPQCLAVREALDAAGEPYRFVDAMVFDDPVINQLCEDNDVSDLPHVQLLDDQEKVISQVSGDILPAHVFTLLDRFR